MSSREAFLDRVREAAERGKEYRIHSPVIADDVGYLGAGVDLVARFAMEVTAVGGEAFVVPDSIAAGDQLSRLLTECQAASAICWQHELLDRIGVFELLDAAGVERLNYERLVSMPPIEQRRRLLQCNVGITSCDCAIAETGTLMMCSQAGQERVASLLPPTHIAIVERQQIVPDLIDAFQHLANRPTGLPSNVTFITGPSKTGDIELQLTTGVHGPGKWRVIVIS